MRRIIVCLAALCLLAACNPAINVRDEAADQVVKSTFSDVRMRNPHIFEILTPQMQNQLTPELLDQVREHIPPTLPRSRTPIATRVRSGPQGQILEATDQYDFGDDVLTVQTLLVRPAAEGPWLVNGFHIHLANAQLIAADRFTAPGKTPVQYLFLVLTLLSPLTMIAALVKVIGAKGLRRKWLWGPLAFVGLMQLQMNWTTGQIGWTPISLQILGFGIVKSAPAVAPWVLFFTVPVFALLILFGVLANPKRAKPPAPQPEQAF
jgi:hypothetical protein